jgi:hypothetical protein
MRVVILTTVWGRPALTRAVLAYYVQVAVGLAVRGIELEVLAVTSTEDPDPPDLMRDRWERVSMCNASNDDLCSKWNAGVRAALEAWPDLGALITVGSDDLLTWEYIDLATRLIRYGHKTLSPDVCHFYDWETGRAVKLKPFFGGAGRVFSRDVIDALGGQLWPGDYDRSDPDLNPDILQLQHLRRAGYSDERLRLDDHVTLDRFPMVLDIKTGDNIRPFANFDPAANHACIDVNGERIRGHFPWGPIFAPKAGQVGSPVNSDVI